MTENPSANSPAPIVLIGGPTASGKSALALHLGEMLAQCGRPAAIINADALQLYRDLHVLTARPSAEDEARLPHRLYGVLDASERGTVARWLGLVHEAIAHAHAQGEIPLITGGTGMYLRALRTGLAEIPALDEAIRQQAVALHTQLGGAAFRRHLAELDPEGAVRLKDGDTQRLIRAYEVVRSTGHPLAYWHAHAHHGPPAHWQFHELVVEPTRERLYANCNRRFDLMLQAGALDEVKALAARALDPDLPAMKAVGVPELLAWLNGQWTREQAIEKATQATRHYAKRQLTWFRHQMPQAQRANPENRAQTALLLDQVCRVFTAC